MFFFLTILLKIVLAAANEHTGYYDAYVHHNINSNFNHQDIIKNISTNKILNCMTDCNKLIQCKSLIYDHQKAVCLQLSVTIIADNMTIDTNTNLYIKKCKL
jgi:hypothetical protein